MRTGFVDTMHDLHERVAPEPPQSDGSQDVTLGMAALFGIFLAVLLVCAVFFGFGYSTGRTLHGSPAQAGTLQPAPAKTGLANSESSAPSTALSLTPATPIAKPSPAAAMIEAPPLSSMFNGESASERQVPAAHPRTSLAADPASVNRTAQPAGAGAGIMVQIAAVAKQGDADALARALRASGYDAMVRTEPQDALLHVQVGPFANRDAARAMRARLQAAGYNAFMKP